MTNNHELHVVLGASGALGNAVVQELIVRGKRVRAVNRSGVANLPKGVELVKGDVTNSTSVCQVCQGATVVYHCVNAPYTKWPTLLAPLMEGIITGAASAGANLVYGDNLYMYGPVSGKISPDLPYSATGRKGKTRATIAKTLMEAHQSGKVRAAIARASDFFGPMVLNSMVGEMVFRPALEGKTVDVLGNPDVPHTYTYIKDFAKGLVTLGEHEEALGQIWHIPSAETLTTRQFIELIFQKAEKSPKIRAVPKTIVALLALVNPMLREIQEMLYEFEEPFVVDSSKYEKTFGNQTTSHDRAIGETLAWFRMH